MKDKPMHNCTNNDCDNRSSIDVLEVKIARVEKINNKLSKELDKASKELANATEEIKRLKSYKNHIRSALNDIFTIISDLIKDILGSWYKIFALLTILGFLINSLKN